MPSPLERPEELMVRGPSARMRADESGGRARAWITKVLPYNSSYSSNL
jgi:hypothetical protein